ncbi:MAG: carboxylesterase [Acidimicrobiaceae bacterium]|nr:carboxylesterase [Acidimicrobiaceae bacterium]
MTEHVNVDNFVRAETDRMFAALQRDAGGINRFTHHREPADVEHQTVIRLNRDTLYSFAIVDISRGATVTIPDAGDRYVSVMVVDQDHFVHDVLHDPGAHELTRDQIGSSYVLVAARVLVDPNDPDDLAAVAAVQDGFDLTADSAIPFELPDYDKASFDTTRQALLQLAAGLTGFDRMFGRRDEVDPVRHLLGTAAGWGGLPTSEATYIGVSPGLPVGEYELTVGDVPVDGFWSISMYNADGFFEPNPQGAYSINNITGVRNDDGTITVRFGGDGSAPNTLPLTEGWNYLVRLYRPRPEILDGSWSFPSLPH